MVVSAGPLTPITATSVNAVKGSLEDIVNWSGKDAIQVGQTKTEHTLQNKSYIPYYE